MKKKILIGSIIAVVILVLVSFTSVVGYSSVKSNPDNTIITDEWDFEYCKDFLFETLVEISNNEDVNDLINSNNQNLFSTNSNHKTFFPLRKNINKLTVEKLDFIYKIGLRLIDRLGEEKVAEIMETISIDKPEFTDEIDTTILGNDELRERIYTLNEMNEEEISILDFTDNPIICGILAVIFFVLLCIITPINIFLDGILAPLGAYYLYMFIFLIFSPIYFFAIVIGISMIIPCLPLPYYP